MKTLKELDEELIRLRDEPIYDSTDRSNNTQSLVDLAESLIDLLNKPDDRPKIFKEWLEGYFQFYIDNGSNTSISIVREVEKKFKEIFESES